MRVPREICALILVFCARRALANTEIVNFQASLSPNTAVAQASEWPVVDSTSSTLHLRVLPAPLDTPATRICEPSAKHPAQPCPHETWLNIDLDDDLWSTYSVFTLRISWPASNPARFYIDMYSPDTLRGVLDDTKHTPTPHTTEGAYTRRKYARIRLVDEGVLTPTTANGNRTVEPVSFLVTVEPMYLGVVPASLLPTILFLVGLLSVAGFVAFPRIHAYLSAAASQVKTEYGVTEERRKQL
ncbi:hypothetical protein C8Q77DRAFT_1186259 [Trametes polyzona]|nr:hypothetical protein C8Q77DRAFT_1186259 [Trametes polyzona]